MTITRAGLANEIDGFDLQIKSLNEAKSEAYKAYRAQLEETMEPRRASAELAATKAAIAKRRKLRENPTKTAEKDDLTDAILFEIMPEASRAREEAAGPDDELDRKAPADGGQSPAGGEKEITEPQPNAAQSAQASGPETSTLDGGRADETPVDDSEPNATPAERAKGPWGSGSGVTAGETATKFTPLSKDETPLERCLRNKPNCQHPEACRSSVFNEHCRACRGVMASLETEGSAA